MAIKKQPLKFIVRIALAGVYDAPIAAATLAEAQEKARTMGHVELSSAVFDEAAEEATAEFRVLGVMDERWPELP